jgi:hypothetical protein
MSSVFQFSVPFTVEGQLTAKKDVKHQESPHHGSNSARRAAPDLLHAPVLARAATNQHQTPTRSESAFADEARMRLIRSVTRNRSLGPSASGQPSQTSGLYKSLAQSNTFLRRAQNLSRHSPQGTENISARI